MVAVNPTQVGHGPPRNTEFHLASQNPVMQRTLDLARGVAATPTTVLVTGESGTGKEVLAQHMHERSPRRNQTFIAVNCGAIPSTLMESELFGHEKGAFSGADSRRIGKFEAADGGTLLLDEIGELPLEMQAKLLRVLQEGEVDRLGGTRPISVDVRLIATTNRDLKEMVRLGTFREDLYYRINVFPLHVPPLRARMEDLLPVTGTLIDRLSTRLNRPAPPIASDAIAKLRSWTYPGNIRELNNILERALILANGGPLEASHIHLDNGSNPPADGSSYQSEAEEWLETHVTLRELERTAILRTLALCEGNRTHASNRLGISIRTLRNRLKEYRSDGIPVPAPPNVGTSDHA